MLHFDERFEERRLNLQGYRRFSNNYSVRCLAIRVLVLMIEMLRESKFFWYFRNAKHIVATPEKLHCTLISRAHFTLRALLPVFVSIACGTNLASIVLSQVFCNQKGDFLNHPDTVLWSTALSILTQYGFGCFSDVRADFRLVNHKFPN